jgi:hypothetical protein
MRPTSFLVAAGLLTLVGCNRLHLYPVKGPRIEQGNADVIRVTASGLLFGTIRFTLPNGEACVGPWSRVSKGQRLDDLAFGWDAVYGPGFYVARVLGSLQHGRAEVTGNQGSRFRLEFTQETVEGSPLLGVAVDQDGNVYKLAQ